MIVAEIYKQGDGKIIGFSVDGHANTAARGFDIYCAGASMMSQSTFLCLRDHLKRDFTWDAAHGRLMLRLKDPPDDKTEVAFQTMLIGMKELEKLAPQIIKVTEKNFLGGETK
ncbi:MAG: ribosomal-processing cysteine protease Prp [Quinella sp. 2Q5]|nr:ribosomal-processing cysteine protease Prp [Quinella sp. 2Q5]